MLDHVAPHVITDTLDIEPATSPDTYSRALARGSDLGNLSPVSA